jgi:hypothetical protein
MAHKNFDESLWIVDVYPMTRVLESMDLQSGRSMEGVCAFLHGAAPSIGVLCHKELVADPTRVG